MKAPVPVPVTYLINMESFTVFRGWGLEIFRKATGHYNCGGLVADISVGGRGKTSKLGVYGGH